MKILSIDSSSTPASVALLFDGKIIGEFYLNNKLTHSQTIMALTDELLKISGVALSDIDYIAVSAGPGSFTGLRIGIAAAKGLAFGADKKCIPVSSLETVAYNFLGEDIYACVCFDARCSQVYNSIFKVSGEEVERITEDRALSIDELVSEIKKLSGKVVLSGDGAHLVMEKCKTKNVFLSPEGKRYQKASAAGIIAGKHEDMAQSSESLVPYYIRMPQAQRERLKREENK